MNEPPLWQTSAEGYTPPRPPSGVRRVAWETPGLARRGPSREVWNPSTVPARDRGGGFIRALALGILLLLPRVAFGQGGAAGSLVGHIIDQTGQPLPGVKVSLRSPTQIGGARTTYSDSEGSFRVPQLFPGKFEVVASAPRMKTYVGKDIQIGVVSAVEVNIVMEVETSNVEEVKVVEKAPVVSTSTSNVKEVYDLDYLESLPMVSRDQVHTQMIDEVA